MHADGLTLFETAGRRSVSGGWRTQRRNRSTGPYVAFVLNRQVNPTNVCVLACRFCDFAAKVGDDHAYEMSARARSAKKRLGAGA